MPKAQNAFNHQNLSAQLVKRIQRHLDDNDDLMDSLVIGIFGEWGSGKSNQLHLIREAFQELDKEQQDKPPIIVVPFNPWRYEKEDHLIVPLFKTVELSIEKYVAKHKSFLEKVGGSSLSLLVKGGKFFGLSAMAFLQAFKFKYKQGDAEVEADVKKMIDGFKSIDLSDEQTKTPLQMLESFYFEFEHSLKEYTDPTDDNSFRLLFLIDDLDRCLPEKAVEMLEAIKLFLDVQGCAFVLALDDEVVERGIIHRYRDYLFQNNGKQDDKKGLAHLPITGMEYLEKIIHLPFRLPMPSEAEIREFLLDKYQDNLFKPTRNKAEQQQLESDHDHNNVTELDDEAQDLLDLFVKHIPPVPRKQIRMAELVLLMQDIAEVSDCKQRIRLLPLAELTLLQLFAPELYRFGRRKYDGFMLTLREWADKEANWGHTAFKDHYEKRLIEPEAGKNALTQSQLTEKRNFDRIYAPMLDILEDVSHSRSGFKIFDFIKQSSLSQIPVNEMLLYFGFVDEAALNKTNASISKSDQPIAEPIYAVANLSDPNTFLDMLFSATEGGWQSVVNMSELQGKVLDEQTFKQIYERLQEGSFDSTLQGKQTTWLGLLLPFLTPDQFKRLHTLDTFNNLFLQTADIENQLDELSEQAKLIHSMTSEQQVIIEPAIQQQREASQAYMFDRYKDIKQRAEAGLLLGWLGDQRAGVDIKQQNGITIPDIDWVLIEAKGKSFMMGSDEHGNENPPHKQTMPVNYRLSRYPITNAQYQAFIDDKGYQTDAHWSDKAKRWKKEKNIQLPSYWDDEKSNCPNQPIVGISWFEAMAYAKWLNQYEEGTVRLPTEREWEFAVRGEQSLVYPWGNDWQGNRANSKESGIKRTSSVGLFNQVKDSPFELDDVAGNVWEWTSSNYLNYEYKDRDSNENQAFVLRGGSWGNDSGNCRSSVRSWSDPVLWYYVVGFRLLLSLASDS